MMSKNEDDDVRVVMLPWLAFGHMIPFLDLSIAFAKSGIHVYFLSTPRNIQRLHQRIPPNLPHLIEFVSFPLPKLDGSNLLPEDAEATVDIPADKMDCLKIACDLLQEPVKNFIAGKLPNWIIVDFFPHWAVDIAHNLNIPIITYCICSASTAVFFWTPEFIVGEGKREARTSPQDLTAPPDWVDFPSQVACRNHEATVLYNVLYGKNASGVPDGARLMRLVQASQAIAIRTSLEFEGDYVKQHSNLSGKPVFPVGFLPPEKVQGRSTIREESWCKIFDWLDQQSPRSVMFVGFGSEYKLKKEEIHEIAHGVELSGLPFLWSLRKPDWATHDGIDALPPGFISRTAGRGVVQIGWAPQREILAHPSVGGTLFHAGWASIVETIVYGHCLVLLPFIIAQPLDTRLLVEKGLAVEVERADDGSFTRNDIANALQKAMVSKEGEALRARTKEAADGIFGNQKLNDDCLKKFIEYLKNGTPQHK
ncbi:UDP-glycosyltransferase 91C1 [Sesamum indicum]|uniref:UDP-glycosyltransferase 91C1 n=1 Tax=Sesamum indicum TaxID=4182 RepID=A0A6I9UF71_SESIN|nr:UDP-glycosyltransferase 91C1 [Sesamum indicum]